MVAATALGLVPGCRSDEPTAAAAQGAVAPSAGRPLQHRANRSDPTAWDMSLLERDGRTYAFVGVQSFGFRIYDVTDPEQPTLAGEYQSPGSENSVEVGGRLAILTREVHGARNIAGVPCDADAGYCVGGIELVDISDLAHPVHASFLRTGYAISNATLAGDTAYLASRNAHTLDIVDVSDPRNPQIVHRWARADAFVEDVRNERNFEVGGNGTRPCELPESPQGRCSTFPEGEPFGFTPHDVAVRDDPTLGRRLYVAARTRFFYILDANDPHDLRIVAKVGTPSHGSIHRREPPDYAMMAEGHTAMPSPDGNWLVVSDQRPLEAPCPGGGLHIYDIRDERAPVRRGVYFANYRAVGAGVAFDNFCSPNYFQFLPDRNVVTVGWQSAGVWVVQIDAPPREAGELEQGPTTLPGQHTTWGRTLGYARETGAHAIAALPLVRAEHRLVVLASDANRGFDVFRFPGLLPPSAR